MKNVYLILAHKNPGQVYKLINELVDRDSFVLLHIDRKTGTLFEHFPEREIPNLWICEDSIEVNWAGFSQVKATLKLIDLLFELALPFDYVHLMSGQDFPIKPGSVIREFFQRNCGKNFINYCSIPVKGMKKFRGNLDKIAYFWEVDRLGNDAAYQMFEKQKESGIKRKFPAGYRPYSGSQWWSLHVDCITYIHERCKPGDILYDFYENTYVPDEMFFQTVIMNSAFKDTVVSTNCRHIHWIHETGHPAVLTKADYFRLVESPDLFARKFDIETDSSILDYLSMYMNKSVKSIN